MRAERSQRDREETERGREAKDGDVLPTASSNRRTRGATGPEGLWGSVPLSKDSIVRHRNHLFR
mgnify:CR=1 FL=1